MAPPTLAQIDPKALAAEVCNAVVDHMHSLALRLSPAMLRLDGLEPGGAGSDLSFTVQILAAYAQRGLPAFDWQDHGCAADALLDVCSALYSRASGPFGAGVLDEADRDPETALDVVLLAAYTRVQIDRRENVSSRGVAALAGLSDRQVRRLADAGELAWAEKVEGVPWALNPADAARWLSGRGVKGFER